MSRFDSAMALFEINNLLGCFFILKGTEMNLKGKIKKLQTAIMHQGLIVTINQTQFYSEEQKRLINVYRLATKVTYIKNNGETGTKDYEILNTCSAVDLVMCLVDIYNEVKNHDE